MCTHWHDCVSQLGGPSSRGIADTCGKERRNMPQCHTPECLLLAHHCATRNSYARWGCVPHDARLNLVVLAEGRARAPTQEPRGCRAPGGCGSGVTRRRQTSPVHGRASRRSSRRTRHTSRPRLECQKPPSFVLGWVWDTCSAWMADRLATSRGGCQVRRRTSRRVLQPCVSRLCGVF